MDKAIKDNEALKEYDEYRFRKIDKQMGESLKRKVGLMSRVNVLQYTVVSQIVQKDYEEAVKSLDQYIEKNSKYPRFKWKVQVYQKHCHTLIHALKMKRNFPGLSQLPLTRQQDVLRKVVEHFNELSAYLRRIEIMEKEIILEDMKSTSVFIKALSVSAILIFATAFFVDFGAQWMSALVFLDESYSGLINLLF